MIFFRNSAEIGAQLCTGIGGKKQKHLSPICYKLLVSFNSELQFIYVSAILKRGKTTLRRPSREDIDDTSDGKLPSLAVL